MGNCCGRAQSKHVGQRDHIVLFAMNDDRVGRDVFDRKSLDGRADQYQALRRHLMRNTGLHVAAEGESSEHRRRRRDGRELLLGECQRGERIVGLADAVIECTFAVARAAEVETHACVAERDEGLGERLCDLVVQRPALQRMRMRDQRNAARRGIGHVERDFKRSGRTGDARTRFASRQIFSLSTTRPWTMCESMISSMSSRST